MTGLVVSLFVALFTVSIAFPFSVNGLVRRHTLAKLKLRSCYWFHISADDGIWTSFIFVHFSNLDANIDYLKRLKQELELLLNNTLSGHKELLRNTVHYKPQQLLRI